MVPWILFLVIYNKYYISGFGHIVIYFIVGTFFFTILFIMKNNSIVFKETEYKRNLATKEKDVFEKKLVEKEKLNNKIHIKENQQVKKEKELKTIVQKYPKLHIYPFKSGKIEYEISGNVKAKETIYFDHYGLRELTITETDYGDGKKDKQMVLVDNRYIYIIDLNVKIGTIAISNLVKNVGENVDYNDVLKYRLRQLNPVQLGMGYVLGKNCKIWVSKNKKIKIWTWKGLILKKVIYKSNYPSIVYEAKELKINIDIPNEQFRIPEGTKFIKYNKLPK